MSGWADADAELFRAVVDAFDVSATLQPQDGGDPVPFSGSIEQQPLLEAYGPGSSQGTSVVHLFVYMPDIAPQPRRGDTVLFNGNTYLITETPTVENGGSTLKLRKIDA